MLSKSFCSLNQKVSRKTTCSGLFVLRLKDLNPNDSEHGFIIYALLSEYFYSQPMSGWLPTTLWEGSGPRLLQLRLLEFEPNAFFHKNSKSGRNRLMWFGPFRLFSIKSALLISAYVSGCLFSALRNIPRLQVQHAMAASSATNYQNTPLLSKFDVKSLDALSLLKHQNLLVAVAWPVSSDLFQMEH